MRGQSNLEIAQAQADLLKRTYEASQQSYNALVETYGNLEQQANDLEETWKAENADKIDERRMLSEASAATLADVKTSEQIAAEMMREDAEYQKTLKAIRDEQERVNSQITESGYKVATLREQQEASETRLQEIRVKA